MTRAEELKLKEAKYRKDYEKYKERQREKSRRWYWENRDWALKKAAIGRQRRRDKAMANAKPKPVTPSIESIEQSLPFAMRSNTERLREAFLNIPILQRPPYDVYLKLKTIEYYKEKANE
jgi:hypothetical protein